MPRVDHSPRRYRLIIFDLDETLLAREAAWRYAVEEAVAAVTGRRPDVRPLAAEYRVRPWRHALTILLDDREAIDRCETLCAEMYQRSAMKRLLIPEGMGMALDQVRAERVEIGAVSRERHGSARKQVESTGLERFLTVLAATPADGGWDAAERIAQCLAFVGCAAQQAAYVSGDRFDLGRAERAGVAAFEAGWAATEATGYTRLGGPGDVPELARLREW